MEQIAANGVTWTYTQVCENPVAAGATAIPILISLIIKYTRK